MPFPQVARRASIGTGCVAAIVVALASPAAAHVTVNPGTGEPGGYGTFDLQVPNEETDADTTMMQLYLPTDHPIASVSVQPTPGWTVQVVKGNLPKPVKTDDGEVSQAVSRITWSGGKIEPGRFQRFGLSLGPLPTDTSTLYFKVLQTYTDKSGKTDVVRWIDIPSGGAEPEHPAPSITLIKAAGPRAVPAVKTKGDSGAATVLGVIGLVAGLLGLAIGLAAFIRSGRSASA